MAGLRPYLISFAMVLLFGFFILGFSLTFLQTNNPNSAILTSTGNNISSSLNDALINFSSTSTNAFFTLAKENPSPTDYIFLIFRGAFDIPISFLGLILKGGNAIVQMLFVGFGGTPFAVVLTITISMILSVMAITAVFLVIKAIRSGESER